MSTNAKKRKDYIADVKSAYEALQTLPDYHKLDHYGPLEEQVLGGKNISKGDLVNLLQNSITHDLNGENDPDDITKRFEPEYTRCITTLDDEFETRLKFFDTLMAYARNVGKDHLTGNAIGRWRQVKKHLKQVRSLVREKGLTPDDAQVNFEYQINESRQALVGFRQYLSHQYHLAGKAQSGK